MAAILELKYFNSFWLKKMVNVSKPKQTTAITGAAITSQNQFTITAANANIVVGQQVSGAGVSTTLPTVIYVSGTTITVSSVQTIAAGTTLTFGPITDFTYIPNAFNADIYDWAIEEARIRGGYNNTSVDLGVKAYLVEEDINQQKRTNGLIYSGLYNSRTGVNNTNQFPAGEDITRSVDPANGSIQKLYSEDTNLTIFQESKVSKALIDKQAVYSADGQPMTTSGKVVIGQIQAYAGNYGISTNPESFAVYGYRKYFADKNRNAILRLSQDGITEVSSYGMNSYFRNIMIAQGDGGKIIGGWDMYNKQYVVSLQAENSGNFTIAFDEDTNGWISSFSYIPQRMFSLKNKFYSAFNGTIWEHYSNATGAKFYDTVSPPYISVVFNDSPSEIKNFNTLNYEGTPIWSAISVTSDLATGVAIRPQAVAYDLSTMEEQIFDSTFKVKEGKSFGNILGYPAFQSVGTVLPGQTVSGIKGTYLNVIFSITSGTTTNSGDLFAVSTEYVNSLY